MEKQTWVHPDNEILLKDKKRKELLNTWNNLDGSQGQYANQKEKN